MFDFEKLEVYKKAKVFNKSISNFLFISKVDKTTHDQLRRAAFSIMLNIAEGTGRFTMKDKRNFYVIARGSAYECVAILDYIKDINQISANDFEKYYQSLEQLSKMLYALISKLNE